MTTQANPYTRYKIDPAEWQMVGVFYQGDDPFGYEFFADDMDALHLELARITGIEVEYETTRLSGTIVHPDEHGRLMSAVERHRNGGCASCGAHYVYGAVFVSYAMTHDATEPTLIAVGHDCSRNYFAVDTKMDIKAREMRKAAETAKRNAENAAKAAAFLADKPELVAAFETDHHIVRDIADKLQRYGDISERQVELVHKIARETAEFEARKAEREAAMADVPALEAGRRELAGTIYSTKWQDNDFGGSLKMLVELEAGQRVWGTVPAAIADAAYEADAELAGSLVSFTATVEPSDDDPHFGFFKRPTKATIELKEEK